MRADGLPTPSPAEASLNDSAPASADPGLLGAARQRSAAACFGRSLNMERVARHALSWLSGRMHALGLAHGMAAPAHVGVLRGLVPHEHGRAV